MTAPANIRELLPLYAVNALAADEAAEVERAVQADPALAAELDSYLGLLTPVTPSPDVKARLLASIGSGRFERFADRMAKLFDVTLDRARELLGLVERDVSWENPMPGIALIHFDGGPACAAADCGFVRIQPGCTFPWHTHRGEEINVILSGTLRDSTGKVLQAGDELVQQASTQHDLTAGTDEVIYVARAMNGIEVSGPRS
ncbi:MAG TPA: cupin domain-containing protein [Kofleriaceae bacterium]|nr:cupin domain-containing protein [Kofleriaceae bacterium]